MNLRRRTAGELLDHARELDERHLALLRQHPSKGRLARPAQADQRDPVLAMRVTWRLREHLRKRHAGALQRCLVTSLQQFADQQPFGGSGGFVADHFGQRAVQRRRDLPQHQHRRIPHTGFQIGQMTLRQAGFSRQRLARHAAARTQQAHALAHRRQKRIALLALASALRPAIGRAVGPTRAACVLVGRIVQRRGSVILIHV